MPVIEARISQTKCLIALWMKVHALQILMRLPWIFILVFADGTAIQEPGATGTTWKARFPLG
jgi:hypothetical protein